jgi:hypothetical protein
MFCSLLLLLLLLVLVMMAMLLLLLLASVLLKVRSLSHCVLMLVSGGCGFMMLVLGK